MPSVHAPPGEDDDVSSEGLESIFEVEGPVATVRRKPEPDPPLDSLVRDFATSFRLFAQEWQHA